MKTGTDISIPECISNGYPIVYHKTDEAMDPNREYKLTISNPKEWKDNLEHIPDCDITYSFNGNVSYITLWEEFGSNGESIKEYCDFKNCPIPSPTEEPSFNDFVTLAGIVHRYCGIY